MPLITFAVASAAVSSRLEHGKVDWHVSLNLSLPLEEHLTLATGEDVRTIRLGFTLKALTPENDRWLQERSGTSKYPIIGQMHYFEGPSAILSDAHVPSEAFDRIFDLVQAGGVPTSISLDVQDMGYDWRPDGSGKLWDNRAMPIVQVNNVSFDVLIAGPLLEKDENQIAELVKLVRGSLTLQKWMLVALILATGALAFGR